MTLDEVQAEYYGLVESGEDPREYVLRCSAKHIETAFAPLMEASQLSPSEWEEPANVCGFEVEIEDRTDWVVAPK